MAAKLTIGFLGSGKMATALAKGIVSAGLVKPARIRASDPVPAAQKAFSQETGASISDNNLNVVRFANVLVLAVKPVNVAPLLEEIRPAITRGHLLISIAAGIPIAKLEDALPAGSRVIRVMPNTPALVGASASGLCVGKIGLSRRRRVDAETSFRSGPGFSSEGISAGRRHRPQRQRASLRLSDD